MNGRQRGRSLTTFRRVERAVSLAGLVLVVACLYWARAVAIPLAVALLLSALLSPIVARLERRGLGSVPATLVTVLLASALLGAVAWTVTKQAGILVDELPRHQQMMRQRVADLRQFFGTTLVGKAQETAREVTEQIARPARSPATGAPSPVPVVITPDGPLVPLPSLLESVLSAGLVVALVVFLLIRRQELRARFVRVIGYGRLTLTTRTLEEAGMRIGRSLFVMSVVNASFGAALGLGLAAIGLPYAILWGFLAAALRFIPYIGTWGAAALPFLLSLAVFDGWTRPLLVAGLFVALEVLAYFLAEPVLYRQSVGVSEVALLVALAFWTWLWGPIGLMLGTPLTVCLIVIGKYVPELDFLSILLAAEAPVAPGLQFYERLLVFEQAEADRLVEDYAPVRGTVDGEPPAIYAFLGSSRLEEPLNRYAASVVFHGHAHRGQPEATTANGTPVYNVALPLLQSLYPDQPPFRVVEVPAVDRERPAPAAPGSAPTP